MMVPQSETTSSSSSVRPPTSACMIAVRLSSRGSSRRAVTSDRTASNIHIWPSMAFMNSGDPGREYTTSWHGSA